MHEPTEKSFNINRFFLLDFMLNLYVLMIQGTSGIKNVWVKCNSWTLYIYFAQICPNKELAFHVPTTSKLYAQMYVVISILAH